MCNKNQIINWLKFNHPELSWTRAPGDESPTGVDSLYINRLEGYEISDFIYEFFKKLLYKM